MTGEAFAAALLGAVAVACWVAPRPYVPRMQPVSPAQRPSVRRTDPLQGFRLPLACVAAGAGIAFVVGGLLGLTLGAGAAVLTAHLSRRLQTTTDLRRRTRLRADLPLAGDLLSSLLMAGAAPGPAAGTVGRALGGPLGTELERVAAALELGATPATAWARLMIDPATAALARPLVRAAERGSPSAATIARVGDDLRRQARERATAAADVVAVRGVGPLGLCFLPAFVLLGVVPLVAGSVLALLAG